MEYKPYNPVVSVETGHNRKQLWNVKFLDHNGNPRNVACHSDEEAEKMCQLIRVAGDLVVEPFQICPLEVVAGHAEYMSLGHVDKSLFVALVNYEHETNFKVQEVEHGYVRPKGNQAAGHKFGFERCGPDDQHSMAATIVVR